MAFIAQGHRFQCRQAHYPFPAGEAAGRERNRVQEGEEASSHIPRRPLFRCGYTVTDGVTRDARFVTPLFNALRLLYGTCHTENEADEEFRF